MQYLGGKTKIAKWLVSSMRPRIAGRPFWDAFCGGLSVSLALSEVAGKGLVTDANPALIALYQAVLAGWDPPETISEEEYTAAKALPDTDPRKAFVGFGCSFGAKWFGGYARAPKTGRNFAASTRSGLLEDVRLLADRGCEFACVNFLDVDPQPIPFVLYLDPPYLDTTGYAAVAPFNHQRFYERVAGWQRHTDVFVSEYSMPFGECVMEFSHDVTAGLAKGKKSTERLYMFARAA